MKKNLLISTTVLTLLLFAMVACQPEITLIEPPSLPDPPDTSSWPLALNETLDSGESGFGEKENAYGIWTHRDGAYVLEGSREGWVYWSGEIGSFDDYHLKVDMRLDAGTGTAGVLLRTDLDAYEFYMATLSVNGHLTANKATGIEAEQILWQAVDLSTNGLVEIERGERIELEVIALGPEMWFIVEDQLIGHLEDDSFASGGVAVVIEHNEGELTRYWFDNVRVHAPDNGSDG